MKNRRFDGRYLCAEMVRLDWMVGEDTPRSEQAILEDISALGGCVQADEPIALGSSMMLTVGSTPFYGYVCYCNHRDEGYFIGLSFSYESVWSASLVRPQHLTNLAELGQYLP